MLLCRNLNQSGDALPPPTQRAAGLSAQRGAAVGEVLRRFQMFEQGFRSGSTRNWEEREYEAAEREAHALRAERHAPMEGPMNNGVLEEMRLQRRDRERIERMIDQAKRIENSLRLVHDERTALGGGSRARIGAILDAVEDDHLALGDELRAMSLDYAPIGPRAR